MKQSKQVQEFHVAFGLNIKEKPCIPESHIVELRNKLIREEVEELCKGLDEGNLVEVADGIIDSIYVLLGTALECGLHELIEKMFDEVHRSNMSKLDKNGKPIYREDGKVMKSELFTKPDLEKIIFSKLTLQEKVQKILGNDFCIMCEKDKSKTFGFIIGGDSCKIWVQINNKHCTTEFISFNISYEELEVIIGNLLYNISKQ
jgi:predicted HAD superfamily Cof-like phosphohydrolase